ncbi:unnamed protein product [Boreogadus saida]
MVKPQSQHSGGRGVEQAGCSYAGDGEASWTAPGVSSSPAGRQAVPFLLNSRFLPLRPVHFRVVALAVHLRAQICRDPHRNRGNVLGSFTAADQSIVCWSHGAWWLSPPATPILFTPLPL